MEYDYCEEITGECQRCKYESDKFKNIAFWKNESSENYDAIFCLNCVLDKQIKAPHIEEILYEGEKEISEEENSATIYTESIVGYSMHTFPITRKKEQWTDPGGDVNGAGPPKRSKTYKVITLDSKKANVEIHSPKYKTKITSDYFANYV